MVTTHTGRPNLWLVEHVTGHFTYFYARLLPLRLNSAASLSVTFLSFRLSTSFHVFYSERHLVMLQLFLHSFTFFLLNLLQDHFSVNSACFPVSVSLSWTKTWTQALLRFFTKKKKLLTPADSSISCLLSRLELWCQQTSQCSPHIPQPWHIFQLLLGHPEAFLGHMWYTISPVCPWTTLECLTNWMCLENLQREAWRSRPDENQLDCFLLMWRSSRSTPSSLQPSELLTLSLRVKHSVHTGIKCWPAVVKSCGFWPKSHRNHPFVKSHT